MLVCIHRVAPSPAVVVLPQRSFSVSPPCSRRNFGRILEADSSKYQPFKSPYSTHHGCVDPLLSGLGPLLSSSGFPRSHNNEYFSDWGYYSQLWFSIPAPVLEQQQPLRPDLPCAFILDSLIFSQLREPQAVCLHR